KIKKKIELQQQNSEELFNKIGNFVEQINDIIDRVNIPTFVVQESKDEIINPESATFIYENIKNEKKDLKWYENSTHLITFGDEKDILHEDIYNFLETLDWNN